MDRLLLSRIDEQLDSSEVAALRFLCLDFVNRKRLEGIGDAKDLFLRLQEQGLLENNVFLSELLRTLRRADLLRRLGTQNRQPLETDSTPVLSDYRKMLYRIYEDLTKENFEKMTFLLNGKLPRRQIEMSNTALDVFAEMEKADLMSNTNVDELYRVLQELDQELALIAMIIMCVVVVLFFCSDIEASVYPDAQPSISSRSPPDEAEYYAMNHQPRGLCVIINNENFIGFELAPRKGTHEDERALKELFRRLGFTVKVYNDLTGEQIRQEIENISRRNFLNDDALVVCVLSHGELGCVFGTDEKKVFLRELTFPFTSDRAATLAGKPKLFFIQACQGGSYQKGSVPLPPMEDTENQTNLEEDAGPIHGETVPSHADFLLGMATVQECKSFRHTSRGSIYIQELCRQLTRSAESDTPDDILSVLTRVNREVGRGDYLKRKQMPEPKYTLTKKVVLKFI
uniref:Caspase-8 n=1 Tax=Salarias fasciatus TaxID=181472 RepID=A0A672G262_SALFA